MGLKEIIPFVFLDIAIVIVAARLMGRLFERFHQPAVIGEILGGILLGPTLLGLLPGELDAVLFPPDVRPLPDGDRPARAGAVHVHRRARGGPDADPRQASRSPPRLALLDRAAVRAGRCCWRSALPGAPRRGRTGDKVSLLAFALFLGAAMSITAFPVLARILTERRMHRTPIGMLALACAAIDDVIAWTLLAVVVAVAGGRSAGVALVLCLTALYALVMFFVVRPLLARLVARLPRGRAPDARHARGDPRRAAALGVRHRGDRHPRTSSARSSSAPSCRAREPRLTRDVLRAARAGQRAPAAAGVLRRRRAPGRHARPSAQGLVELR